ncbi:MAG: hypothetical protein VX777_08860 [Chlamydiota bacterium]|nr:hypothetical protein [Chlamydiota bacterium]
MSEFSSPSVSEVVSSSLHNLSDFENLYHETSKEDEGALADIYGRFLEDLRDNEYDFSLLLEGKDKFESKIDCRVIKEILDLIKVLEVPSSKDRQSKVLSVQSDSFWDSIYEFRVRLEDLQSEALKREI